MCILVPESFNYHLFTINDIETFSWIGNSLTSHVVDVIITRWLVLNAVDCCGAIIIVTEAEPDCSCASSAYSR